MSEVESGILGTMSSFSTSHSLSLVSTVSLFLSISLHSYRAPAKKGKLPAIYDLSEIIIPGKSFRIREGVREILSERVMNRDHDGIHTRNESEDTYMHG